MFRGYGKTKHEIQIDEIKNCFNLFDFSSDEDTRIDYSKDDLINDIKKIIEGDLNYEKLCRL